MTLRFEGEGLEEVGIVEAVEAPAVSGGAEAEAGAGAEVRPGAGAGDAAGGAPPAMAVQPGDVIVRIDPRYFRPAEVETLLGDPGKARRELAWTPEITAREMCREMVAEDRQIARRHALLKAHGLEVPVSVES